MRCTHHIYVINTPGRSCYLLKCSNIQSIWTIHGRNCTGTKQYSTITPGLVHVVTKPMSTSKPTPPPRRTTPGSISHCGCASLATDEWDVQRPPAQTIATIVYDGQPQVTRRTWVSAATSDSLNFYEDYTSSPWTGDVDVVRLWPLPPPLFHWTVELGTRKRNDRAMNARGDGRNE